MHREILTFYAGLAEWQGGVAPQLIGFQQGLAAVIPSLLDYVKPFCAARRSLRPRETLTSSTRTRLLRDVLGRPHRIFPSPTSLRAPRCSPMPQAFPRDWIAHGARNPRRPDASTRRAMAWLSNWSARCACADDLFPARAVPAANESVGIEDRKFHRSRVSSPAPARLRNLQGLSPGRRSERDPAAIPEVDELAGLPLDLWAVENGYHKLQPNLAGV